MLLLVLLYTFIFPASVRSGEPDRNVKNETAKSIGNPTFQKEYIGEKEIYVQAGYDIMPYSGVNIGLGGYLKNFNLECNYIIGLTKSKNVYWMERREETAPFAATYRPQGITVKIGYGIKVHRRLRLTPQVGYRFLTLREKTQEIFIPEDSAYRSRYQDGAVKNAGAGSLDFGVRCSFVILPRLGISVTPEYIGCVYKSNGYKELSSVSDQIKGYAEGFGCNFSINFFF